MAPAGTSGGPPRFTQQDNQTIEGLNMSLGKGALLWLIGIPLPIILLLALFWR
jgi:hypothetical protein